MDFYIGGENLTNYFQKSVIVAADQPFSPYFDASLVWGPVTGSMFYTGWRFKLK
jgi:aldehyde:ferredoxin oxidoreductase